MAATDESRIEETIRAMLADGEDVTHGWSDYTIIAEAARRANAPIDTADRAQAEHWNAVISAIRSESDNDGQQRATRGARD